MATLSAPSFADGVYSIFKPDGHYFGELQVVGDVITPSGQEYVLLEMPEEEMLFYVDPDAIYVTIDTRNPVLYQQGPYKGFWLSTGQYNSGRWPICDRDAYDEFGTVYANHGYLSWGNVALTPDGYDVEFYIDLGTCDDSPQEWGINLAYLQAIESSYSQTGGVYDPEPLPTFEIADERGMIFTVEMTPDGTNLYSINPLKIVIPQNTGADSGVYSEHEDLSIFADCSAYSFRRGWGTWGWANAGFFINFGSGGLFFPRVDPPIDNGGGCWE